MFKFLSTDELVAGEKLTVRATLISSIGSARYSLYWLKNDGSMYISQVENGTSIISGVAYTITIPPAFPAGATGIGIALYSPGGGNQQVGDYVDYSNILIKLGSISTAFEPFVSNTYPVTLSEKMHGLSGAEDEVRCDGTVIKRTQKLSFTGQENWSVAATGTGTYRMALGAISPGVKTTMNNVAANAITNRFPVLPSNTTYAQVTGFSFDQNGAIRLYDPNFNTSSAEPWKSYLAAQYATGTPFEVLYELATPQTFTIEPFSIKSLPGTNNIFTDGGDEIATTLNPFGYIFHKLLAL